MTLLFKVILVPIFASAFSMAKEDATLGEFPWTVSLRNSLIGHDCAASILTPDWLIATAYCASINNDLDPDNFVAVAGDFNVAIPDNDETEQTRHIEKVYIHPYFGPEQNADIALIKLREPFEFNDYVQALPLPENRDALESSFQDCYESGWSSQDAHYTLTKSKLTLIDTQVCQEEADDGNYVPSYSFCAGNENGATEMCPGYTGSPVSCVENQGQKVLVGLQSFNWVCNTANSPGIYTSIRALREWIEYILDKEE